MTCKLEFPLWHPEPQLYTPHWLVRMPILHPGAPQGHQAPAVRVPDAGYRLQAQLMRPAAIPAYHLVG